MGIGQQWAGSALRQGIRGAREGWQGALSPQTPEEVTAPDPNPFDNYQSDTWWETPGFTDFQGGTGYLSYTAPDGGQTTQARFGTELPEWAQNDYMDPGAFYAAYEGRLPENRADWIGNMQSAYLARRDNEGAHQRGLDILSEQYARLQGDAADWRNDPNRAAIMEELARRSDPDFNVISDRERAAADLEIAQRYASTMARSQANQAGRGVAGGSAGGSVDRAIEARANALGMTLGAGYDRMDDEARSRALGMLTSTTGAYEGLDQAYSNAMDRMAAERAKSERDIQYIPSDSVPWADLDFAREDAARQEDLFREAMDRLTENNELGWRDRAGNLVNTIGSGGWGMLNEVFNLGFD